jgi:DNA polymerase-3 subunit gamma/tau
MLSKSAFNALLKTLEEPPDHVIFILATTEIHKVPATIISRTQRFDFKRVSKEDIIKNLRRVVKLESIEIDEESLDLIAVMAQGGHRDALGLLEQVTSVDSVINIEITRRILGIPDSNSISMFIGAIFNNNPEEGLKIARRLYDDGSNLNEFCKKVIEKLRGIMLFLAAGDSIFEDTDEEMQKTKFLAAKISLSCLTKIIELFVATNEMLKDVDYPVLPLEIAVVKASYLLYQKDDRMHGNDGISEELPRSELPTQNKVTESIPVLNMTKDIWCQVIETTKKENSTLAALLRDATPSQITDNTMTLKVKFKFHKDRISEEKNRKTLEKIVSEVTGTSYQIVCEILEGKPRSTQLGNKIDLKKTVAEVFEIQG